MAMVSRRDRRIWGVGGKPRCPGEQFGTGSTKEGIVERLKGGGCLRRARGRGVRLGRGNSLHDWESSAHLVQYLSFCFEVLRALKLCCSAQNEICVARPIPSCRCLNVQREHQDHLELQRARVCQKWWLRWIGRRSKAVENGAGTSCKVKVGEESQLTTNRRGDLV